MSVVCPIHLRVDRRRRRGFAAIMAITLIILVGAALVALSAGVVGEVKKTRADAVDAQLRELLIAGATAAAARDAGSAPNGKPVSVQLPADIAGEAGALTFTPMKDGDKLHVVIEAGFARRRASQTLTFAREGERWKVVDARID